MTSYELLDLVISLSNRIDTHWTLFISVHLALIGGIIYVDRPLFRSEKIAALFIYSGFALINFLMMRTQTIFLASVFQQIYDLRNDDCCINNAVIDFVVGQHERNWSSTTMMSIIVTHSTMYAILTLSILYDKSVTDKKNSAAAK